MDKTFNELFDNFFNKKNKPTKDKRKPIVDKIAFLKEELKRVMDAISNIKDVNSIEALEKELDNNLGKPDKTEFYSEDGLFYEKRIWHTPTGDFIKMLVYDDPSLVTAPIPKKSLQKQLDEAVKNEEYEKAAIIRDKLGVSKKSINNDNSK